MTAVGNVQAIFLMPLNVAFWASIHPTASQKLQEFDLDAWGMLGEVAFVSACRSCSAWPCPHGSRASQPAPTRSSRRSPRSPCWPSSWSRSPDNTPLRTDFGYTPERTSREAFGCWRRARGL